MKPDKGILTGFKEHHPDKTSLVCAEILKITYDLGAQLFAETLRAAAPDGDDEILVPALLLRDVCRHVMATAILAKSGFAEPCDLTVRALYESSVALVYMLDGDTAKKAAAYRVIDALEGIKLAKKVSPFTAEGKELRRRLQDDRLGRLDNPIFQNAPDAARQLDETLRELRKDPVRDAAFHEYERILKRQKKGKGSRIPHWYQLFGGPTSVKGLAEKTKTLYAYETFYNLSSKTVHGVNALRFAVIVQKDGTSDIPIMSSRNIETVTASAVVFAMYPYQQIIERFCSPMVPAFNAWLQEVRRLKAKVGMTPSSTTDEGGGG